MKRTLKERFERVPKHIKDKVANEYILIDHGYLCAKKDSVKIVKKYKDLFSSSSAESKLIQEIINEIKSLK